MDDKTKAILVKIQLDNICKALDGTITESVTLDHTGRSSKKIIIEYDITDS